MREESSETAAWLARARAGDHSVLAQLFDHHRGRLRRMVETRLDPRVTARVDPSDVVQEAFLDAEKRLASDLEKPAVSCFVWLRGLTWERLLKTHRHHLGAARRDAARELALPDASSVTLAETLVSPGTSPSLAFARDEMCVLVRRALAALKPADREVIVMYHFEDLTNSEMAQVLGLTESGASMRHGRAVFRLKRLLKDAISPGGSA